MRKLHRYWIVSSSKVNLLKGTLGKLFKAKWTKYGMWVALKEIRDVRMSENEEFEKDVRYLRYSFTLTWLWWLCWCIYRQITLHPNVVRVFGVVEDKKANKVYLVSDFMPLGDLTNFLKTRKSSIDDKARYYMLIGIATGNVVQWIEVNWVNDRNESHSQLQIIASEFINK